MLVLRWPATEARWTLLLTRDPGHLRWAPPHGHIHSGENPAETARRVVLDTGGWSTVLIAPAHENPWPPGVGAGGEQPVPMPWWILQQPADPPCRQRVMATSATRSKPPSKANRGQVGPGYDTMWSQRAGRGFLTGETP
jgi:hypothetical protein